MSFRRVKAGDPVKIPAPAYNAWCEAAEAFRAGNQGFTTPTAGDRPDYTRVKVRNDSGADRSRFDVLGVSGPLFTPTDNLAEFLRAPKLIGALPDADTHAGRFVILLEPLPAGKIGWALAAGVVPVTVNMVAAGDKFADVTDAPGRLSHLRRRRRRPDSVGRHRHGPTPRDGLAWRRRGRVAAVLGNARR